MTKSLVALVIFTLASEALRAQSGQRPDSVRVVVLRDVAVNDKIARLVVASGKSQRNYFHILSPGGAHAVRFWAPRGGYHQLREILVRLHNPGDIVEGQLRVRVASVAADGSPADDNLLPSVVTLTTCTLQQARRHLTLTWPTNRVVVPAGGFFLVIEGLGSFPDEYVSKFIPPSGPKQPAQYEISRHSQPEANPRLVSIMDFPDLGGGSPMTAAGENWHRDAKTQAWRSSSGQKSVVFIEAVFE